MVEVRGQNEPLRGMPSAWECKVFRHSVGDRGQQPPLATMCHRCGKANDSLEEDNT